MPLVDFILCPLMIGLLQAAIRVCDGLFAQHVLVCSTEVYWCVSLIYKQRQRMRSHSLKRC